MGDSDDENFVTFGEPLEPLDEENLPRKKPMTIEDQIATDSQGRRRFHGAFTGGFSAGFFNSVGSRDGWRPQQFKSSRSSKAENVSQRPEDFMDEEDTGEFGIAPIGIRATSDYTDQEKGTKRERSRPNNDGPIPGVPVLHEILKPVSDRIGIALLKRMGWKPGQGIGPRVTKKEKKKNRERNEKKKIYGCSLPNQETKTQKSSEETSDDDDDDHVEILFAPDDYEPFLANPKDNYFGIGYSGLDRRSVLGHINLFDTPTFQLQEKNKKLSIRGQAFGVGAFEADDEDIYARDDMSRYDFTLGPEVKKKLRWSDKSNSISSGKCLEGFVPSKNPLKMKNYYPPPELPKNFKPVHVVRKSRFSPTIESLTWKNSLKKGFVRQELNANDRSVLLDEIPSKKYNSESDEISKKDEENVKKNNSTAVNIISRTLNLSGRDKIKERENFDVKKEKSSNSWLEKLNTTSFIRGGIEGSDESSGCLKNLTEFKSNVNNPDLHLSKPFKMNEEKQKRFDKYLNLVESDEKNKLSSIQPLSMTEWEREREKEEFEQATRLIVNTKSQSNQINSSTHDKSDDPMVNAAKMKMFGKLTRSIELWQPSSIVCKRFNIPEPKNELSKINEKNKKKYSVFDSLDFSGGDTKFQRATDTVETYKEPNIPYNSKENKKNQQETSIKILDIEDIDTSSSKSLKKIRNFEISYEKIFGESSQVLLQTETENKEILVEKEEENEENSKNKNENISKKNDLFKAIFLSSSEDEESDKNDDIPDDENDVKNLLIGKTPSDINVQRNDSPPRGIFAKLDLDDLIKPSCSKNNNDTKIEKNLIIKNNEKDVDRIDESFVEVCEQTSTNQVEILTQVYGPALPTKPVRLENSTNSETIQRPVFRSVVISKFDKMDKNLKWVEKKNKEKKKKKHKNKEKDKKKKNKSKKSKR